MKTQADARAAVRRSGIAVADWAHVLGVTRWAMYKLVKGDSALQEGPLMHRLLDLLDALESRNAEWERIPSGRPHGRPYHRLAGGLRFTSAPLRWHVDFLRGRLVQGPRQVEAESATETLPMKKWFERDSE